MRQINLPRLLFVTLALIALLTMAPRAHADGFSAGGSGGGFSGSGVFTAMNEGGGEYLITGMTGDFSPTLFSPGGFQGNDNLLFPTAAQYVDSSGFSFTSVSGADTDKVDISWVSSSMGSGYQAYIVDEGGNVEVVPVTFSLTADSSSSGLANGLARFGFQVGSPAATPEPSSFVLLGTGLAGLVAAARRKVRAVKVQRADSRSESRLGLG